jgi:hypothetical protein
MLSNYSLYQVAFLWKFISMHVNIRCLILINYNLFIFWLCLPQENRWPIATHGHSTIIIISINKIANGRDGSGT